MDRFDRGTFGRLTFKEEEMSGYLPDGCMFPSDLDEHDALNPEDRDERDAREEHEHMDLALLEEDRCAF
jgi:hypothetical protein